MIKVTSMCMYIVTFNIFSVERQNSKGPDTTRLSRPQLPLESVVTIINTCTPIDNRKVKIPRKRKLFDTPAKKIGKGK